MVFFTRKKRIETQHTAGDGTVYSWLHIPRGLVFRYEYSGFTIEAGDTPYFRLMRENFTHRLVKVLGFATEFQTRDSEFDKAIYIESDDPHFCSRLQTSADLRERIKALLRRDIDSIYVKKKKIFATTQGVPAAPPPGIADEIVHCLNELKRLANTGAVMPGQGRRFAVILSNALMAWAFAAVIAHLFKPYKMVDNSQLWRDVWPYAIVLGIAGILWIRKIFSGSANGWTVFMAFMFGGMVAIPNSVYLGLYAINVHYDASEAIHRTLPVSDTYVSYRRRGGRSYYAGVRNWNDEGKRVWFMIFEDKYPAIKNKGGTVELDTHPGYLGYEWIERYEVHTK